MLHPPSDPAPKHATLNETSDLIGVRGTAITPIRPCGDVEMNGQVLSVISENGQYIEIGTVVIISGKRNGRLLAAEYIGYDSDEHSRRALQLSNTSNLAPG